jgi:hypothetical protein
VALPLLADESKIQAANPPPRLQVSRFDLNGDGRLNATERRAMLKALNQSKRESSQVASTNRPALKAPEHKDRRQERIKKALK